MIGILLVDKPQGFTSHDVIAKLRGVLRERRLGHAGTLDPMATGLLVVMAGRATRAAQFAESQRKRYVAAMRTGIVTDTQDITGNVISRTEMTVTEEELCKLLPEFTGEQMQIPPMYSAIKKDGKKLYELARRGVETEREGRPIEIFSLEYLGRDGGDFLLSVECSKGTYIRTLVHDMGRRLGCGAALSALKRTQTGAFSIESAHSLEQIEEAMKNGEIEKLLLPIDSLFAEHPAITLSEAQKKKCLCGNQFETKAENGDYRVYDAQGDFLMLGSVKSGVMTTIKSFFEI